jgi:hypothetical protein
MGRVLNRLAQWTDSRTLMTLTGVIGLALALLSAIHQGGDTIVPNYVFGWFMFVGFILAAYALVCAGTQLADRPAGTLAGGALFMAFATPDSNRFPGMHLSWLWLLLAVCGAWGWFLAAVSELEDLYAPVSQRFNDVVYSAGWLLTIGLLAIDHTWSMLEYVVIIDAALFISYKLLRSYKPARRQEYGLPVRA